MSKGFNDLANSLEKKIKLIEEAASKTAIGAALIVVEDLAFTTPVDTSEALSNWLTTLRSETSARIPARFLGEGGSTRTASASETISEARSVLAGKKPGDAVYLSNNVPYIRRLNEGYSRQAPAGYVERSVMIGRKSLKNFKLNG